MTDQAAERATEPLDPNRFETFWRKGYKRLIPIVPPGAELSETSSLHKRMAKNPKNDGRGKTPGIRPGRLWMGMNFVPVEATEDVLPIWADMGAGVGIKTGRREGTKFGLFLIDADTGDSKCSAIIAEEIERHMGKLPRRIGNYPKIGYVIRVEGDVTYRRIEFGERDAKNRLLDRVEILGEGRQFVACGIHPKTLKPYFWPEDVPDFDAIPIVTLAQIDTALKAIAARVPSGTAISIEGTGAGSEVDQHHLKDDPERVRRAIEALPNTVVDFATREQWLAVGYAIKASIPDDPEEALDIFQNWSDEYDGVGGLDENGFPTPANDPDYVRSEWNRMQPPFRRGADWLYELVAKHGGTGPDDPIRLIGFERWAETGESQTSQDPFKPEEGTRDALIAVGAFDLAGPKFKIKTIDDIMAMPPPKFLIKRHIPERSVGLVYAAPGAGKTFIVADMLLHVAYDLPDWHGDEINTRGEKTCVIYLAGEGAAGFQARIGAWLKFHNLTDAPRGRFGLIDDSVNFMDVEQVGKLVRTLRAETGCRVSMIAVDTVSRVLPGADENLQKDMTLFVAACDRLRDAFDCAVIGVHHTNKSGEIRGSSVIPGAGDFIFSFERERGASVGVLACVKMKEAVDNWEDRYRLNLIDLSEIEPEMSSLVPQRCEIGEPGESGGATVNAAMAAAVFEAIRAAWVAGNPWSRSARAVGRFYVPLMVDRFKVTADTAKSLMTHWLQLGQVVEATVSGHSKIKGLRVAELAPDEVSKYASTAIPVETKVETEKPKSVFD